MRCNSLPTRAFQVAERSGKDIIGMIEWAMFVGCLLSVIRQWREERGVGLRRFAKAVGVSPTFISKMERGLGPVPGEVTIHKMAAFFGKNPDELLALADKVASDVLALIIQEPAYARFLRAHAHLTKDQWDSLANHPLPTSTNSG